MHVLHAATGCTRTHYIGTEYINDCTLSSVDRQRKRTQRRWCWFSVDHHQGDFAVETVFTVFVVYRMQCLSSPMRKDMTINMTEEWLPRVSIMSLSNPLEVCFYYIFISILFTITTFVNMPFLRNSSRHGGHVKRSSNRTSVTKRCASTHRRRTCAHKTIRSKRRHGCTRKLLGIHTLANSGGRAKTKNNGGSLVTIAENIKNNEGLRNLGKHLFDHSPVVILLQAHGILLITMNVAATYPAFYSMKGFTPQLAETYSQWRNKQVYEYITQLIAITSSKYIICLQEADKTLYDLLLHWQRVTEGKTFLTEFHTEVNRTHEDVPFHYGMFAISSDNPSEDDDLCSYPEFKNSLLLETVNNPTVNNPTKAGEYVYVYEQSRNPNYAKVIRVDGHTVWLKDDGANNLRKAQSKDVWTRNVRAHLMTFSPNLKIANGHFKWIDTTNYTELESDKGALQKLFDMADIVIGDFNRSSPFWEKHEIIKVSGDIETLGYSKKHIKGQSNDSFTVGTDDAIRFKIKQETTDVKPVPLLEKDELITEPKMMLRFKDYLKEKETESLSKADEYRSELLVLEREKLSSLEGEKLSSLEREKLSSLEREKLSSLERERSPPLTRSPSIQRKRSPPLTRSPSIQRNRSPPLTQSSSRPHTPKKPKTTRI